MTKPRSAFRLGIRGRLTLWFIMGAITTVILGVLVIYTSGLGSIQATLGQTYCQIASRTVDQFENRFSQERTLVRNVATDVLTTEVAMEASAAYDGRRAEWIEARQARMDREWRTAGTQLKRLGSLHPQLTHRMRVLARLDDAMSRLSIYDRHAVLLASSVPPEERVARDRAWYKSVSRLDRHFTYIDLGDDRDLMVLVMPIWGGVDIIGYAVTEYFLKVLAAPSRNVRFGATGEAMLVDYAGVPIQGEPRDFLIHAMGTKPPKKRGQTGDDAAAPYWVVHQGDHEWSIWRRLSCVAPLPLVNSLRKRFEMPPWSLVVTQSPDESYLALKTSLDTLALTGVFLILVIGLAGGAVAWHLAAPLKSLQEGVEQFAQGTRDKRVEVESNDEIGQLAAEFNRMADRVTASENELRAFAQAVADAADAIIMTDPAGTIYYANPAFERVTGYGLGEVRGADPSILRAPETPRKTYADMWRSVEDGESWRGELWNRRKNGEVYPVELTISPIHDEQGSVIAVLGVHRDVTLARQYRESLEREVAARTRQITETQGLAAMGRMASMIAHDLRNALSTIKMNLQILNRKHTEAGDTKQELCALGLEQVAYMEDIMRDMLSYARPERLQPEWWDLDEILDGALAAVSHSLDERGIAVVRNDSRGLPTIWGDRVKLIQVTQNLLDNAIQAMSDKDELRISTHLVLEDPDPMVQITVEDNGEGIPADVLPEIFEPFFTTRGKGTGLGLAIVKRIIDQHGGRIEIESDPGKGTAVTITLPTVPQENEAA